MFIQLLIGAIMLGGIYGLLGLGYGIIYKTSGLLTFAQGEVLMIGAFLGLRGALLTLVIGSTTGAVIGIVYILATRKDAATYQIPFGVFLAIGAIAAVWLGDPAAHWYMGLVP